MSSPIKDAMLALGRHADYIEQAVQGTIEPEGAAATSAVTTLRQISALRAAGEEGYRLNQHLRGYIQDALQLFPGYQSLSEIGSRIQQLSYCWDEIENLRPAADMNAIADLAYQINTTVYDIIDAMGRNMLLLQTLMSTRYGDVTSMAAKESQNRYYRKQMDQITADLSRLARVADRLERESSTRGMEDLARFIRRNLLVRITPWMQNMSEMQSTLTRELYRTREIVVNLRRLARADMLLRQQPAWKGIEVELTGDIPDFLLAAKLPRIRPQVDPLDTDREMSREMLDVCRSLPPMKTEKAGGEEPVRYTRKKPSPVAVQLLPEMMAVERLADHISTSEKDTSLLDWRNGDPDAQTVEPALWVAYATLALRARNMPVALVKAPPRPGEGHQHFFTDGLALAGRQHLKR